MGGHGHTCPSLSIQQSFREAGEAFFKSYNTHAISSASFHNRECHVEGWREPKFRQPVFPMVDFQIFRGAAELYNSGEVCFVSATGNRASFIVGDHLVRVEITPSGTKFICTCEAHVHKQLQDKLCKRVIACIMYIYYRKGLFKKC